MKSNYEIREAQLIALGKLIVCLNEFEDLYLNQEGDYEDHISYDFIVDEFRALYIKMASMIQQIEFKQTKGKQNESKD